MSAGPTTRRWLLVSAVVVVVLLATFGLKGCTQPVSPPGGSGTVAVVETEDYLRTARETLGRAPDLATCRTALQQVASHLGRHPELKPPSLTDAQRKVLAEQVGLGEGELTEVDGNFSSLDGHHLDACYLARDAVDFLPREGVSQSDLARAAFAWVVRMVALPPPAEGEAESRPATELTPPQLVLRRGWGTATERGLVFLGLLDQLDIPGCLIGPPGGDGGPDPCWACGALVTRPGGGRDVLLFDPRLGLPLPGPDGKSVLTLAELRKQPDLPAKALGSDPDQGYDLTSARLEESNLFLAPPLSALAPRMRFLAMDLFGAEIRGRLAQDPAELRQTWESAASVEAGKPLPVRFWKAAVGVQRNFWDSAEGGIDTRQQFRRYQFSLIPRQILAQIPPGEGELRNRITGILTHHFVLAPLTQQDEALRTNLPAQRDALVRGNGGQVVEGLVEYRRILSGWKTRLRNQPNAAEELRNWFNKAVAADADLLRARAAQDAGALTAARTHMEEVWKEGETSALVLLQGLTANTVSAEMTFLLAQCMQDRAERLQAQLGGQRDDRRAAAEAWTDAAQWWETFAEENPDHAALPVARRHWARVCEMLGQRDRAAALLEDPSGPLTKLEKTARLYQARQLKKQ